MFTMRQVNMNPLSLFTFILYAIFKLLHDFWVAMASPLNGFAKVLLRLFIVPPKTHTTGGVKVSINGSWSSLHIKVKKIK